MKIGILADVHGNLEALEAVRRDIERERPDRIIFLGDVIGYGANPQECCDIIRGMGPEVILGNHDAVCVGMLSLDWFSDHARKALEWTIPRMKEAHLTWLRTMPLTLAWEGLLFSHGSPREPEKYDYVIEAQDAAKLFLWMEENGVPTVFVGHSHIAVAFVDGKRGRTGITLDWFPEVSYGSGNRTIISVGSVGQPRDNNYRACYGILDTERKVYLSKRVEYDARTASEKIRREGLPEILSARLLIGR